MTNSRSSKRGVQVLVALVVGMLVALGTTAADAAPRKRVVVLEFEGPNAEKFHDEVVKLVKKTYTVVPTEKWNETAEGLDASKVDDAHVKKVAKKLKIDAIISGKIEKRRDDYLIHLKLRTGKTGEIAKPVDTKSTVAHVDSKSATDIKDELVDAIANIDSNHAAKVADADSDDSGDDADAKPKTKAKKKKVADADDGDDADAKPKTKAKKKAKTDDDADAGDSEGGTVKKKSNFGKKKKATDDDDSGDDADAKPVAKKQPEKKVEKKVEKKKAVSDDDSDDADAKPVAKKQPEKKQPEKKEKKKDVEVATVDDPKHDDDDSPLPKGKVKEKKKDPAPKVEPKNDGDSGDSSDDDGDGAKKKKVAAKDPDGGEDGGEVAKSAGDRGVVDPAAALSPGQRAVEANVGLSFIARKLTFVRQADLMNFPPGYKGVPTPGAVVDATIYPLAIGHKNTSLLSGLGFTFDFDRVLKIQSSVKFLDDQNAVQTAKLATTSQSFSVGAVFRYPFNKTAMAPVLALDVRYGQSAFLVAQTIPGTQLSSDIPNVTYKMIEPGVDFRYPVSPKLTLDVGLTAQLISNTGGMQDVMQYGSAKVFGFQAEAGAEYLITKNIFARGLVHFDTIGITYTGNGALTTNRDGDPDVDVAGARDTYYGAMFSVGYLY